MEEKITSDWKLPHYPSECVIDIGNICNLRCPYCPTGIKRDTMKKGFMSFEVFKKIVGKLEDKIFCYELMNWGEPFLNNEILNMTRYLADKGFRVKFDSNICARSFSDIYSEQIIKSGLWKIRVSIDGTSQDIYEKYRINGDINLVFDNLRNISYAKKKLKNRFPIIEWQFLVSKENEHQVEHAKKIAEELELDIVFIPMDTWGDVSKFGFLHDYLFSGKYSRKDWTFKYSIEYSNGNNFWKPIPKFISIDSSTPVLHSQVPVVCFQPFSRMVVNWDGNVLPCMHCYGDEFFIGNILQQNLDEIWYGNKIVGCRSFLLNFPNNNNSKSVCRLYTCAMLKKTL